MISTQRYVEFGQEANIMVNEQRGLDGTGVEFLDSLYSYAMVLTRSHAEAEDLVQETYVRAIPAMSRLRPESNMKGWLFRILRNAWLNQLRKRRTAPERMLSEAEDGTVVEAVDPSKDAYSALVSKIDIERVRGAIKALSPNFREIILLREFEELSYDEIASLLDCPIGTVMSRLARARLKLRELLTRTKPGTLVGKVQDEGLR